MDKGALVTQKRGEDTSSSAWFLDIDSLITSFRNHQYQQLRSSYVDRCNFQASHGLDMTADDLEEGNAIFEAFYNQGYSSKQDTSR
jgi:hypothetical protein